MQNTPPSTFTYDRRGRLQTVTRSGITTTLNYNDANELLSESYAGGILDGLTVTTGYDTLLRRQSLSLNTQPSPLNQTFTYDPVTGRLATIGDGANNQAAYSMLMVHSHPIGIRKKRVGRLIKICHTADDEKNQTANRLEVHRSASD